MMAGMDIDSPPEEQNQALSPRQLIVQRLIQLGIPLDRSNATPSCLVDFIKHDQLLLPTIVHTILPTDEEAVEIRNLLKKESGGGSRSGKLKELYVEGLLWIQWLMFGCDPHDLLKDMTQKAAGTRAVCGAVWGQNDLAYRCRTCEHDPTCAICVPCFQNGNHRDHDYSIMYTGGGCCDCGDETAWKRDGFCSRHKGVQQVQPLSEELAGSVGPTFNILLACWRNKVVSEDHHWRCDRENGSGDATMVANELFSAVVDMLLDFCNCSESLLSFISRRIFECSGLLDILVRAERFLDREVVTKLHELLLKLLGEPLFKYEFAKVLVEYYPFTVDEIIKECTDDMLEIYSLIPTFSVQIFTVPTLTPRLVREVDLLHVLLECLTRLFLSCIGEDGRLQVNKWAKVYETTLRLVEDIRYVLSHDEVCMYIAQQRPDITKAWLRFLSLVQGVDPQKRATGIHTEEDNDNVPAPFVLCYYIGNVHSLFVGGAYSVGEKGDSDEQIYDEAARPHRASFAHNTGGTTDSSNRAERCDDDLIPVRGNCSTIPSSAAWLIFECLKAIDNCFESSYATRNNMISFTASSSRCSDISTLRKKWSRAGASSNRVYRTFFSTEDINGNQVPASHARNTSPLLAERAEALLRDGEPMVVSDIYDMVPEYFSTGALPEEETLEEKNSGSEFEAFVILNSVDWPDIKYDVSSHEISFHIPLHRLLSLSLRRALKTCYGETGIVEKKNGNLPLVSSRHHNFFGEVLRGVHPSGFSAYIMENPLRLRVFCAQVRAGMWRKNGDAAALSCDWYRSVQWLEIGLETDLFLLQCCAALAPPDLFVKRLQERFGLTDYTSLNLAYHNEYESVLVQEMLTLIIQIVKERRFCGLSTVENLKRELVYRLAIGDATHSQLLKSLPRDLSKSDHLRNVLDMLAVYSKPSGMKQGKYSLRKEFWKELDLYHPRWSSRDLQVAEERYFNFCRVSALNAQLPRWTAIFDPLNTISKIATSKTVLQIIRAVIFYAVFTETSSSSRAPDGVLITALHLLSLALDVHETQLSSDQRSCIDLSCESDASFPMFAYACEVFDRDDSDEVCWKNQSLLSLLVSLMRKQREENAYNYGEIRQCNIYSLIESLLKKLAQLSRACLDSLKRLAPEMICHLPGIAMDTSASTSDTEERRAKARARQAAIMEKMKAEQSRFMASLNSEAEGEPDKTRSDQRAPVSELDHASGESAPICSLCRGSDSGSPLCFLILLQKSRLNSFVQRGAISWDDVDQSDKEICRTSERGIGESSCDFSVIREQLLQRARLHAADGTTPAENYTFQDLLGEWLPELSNTHPSNASYYRAGSSLSTSEMLENDVYQSVIGEICGAQYHFTALNGELHYSASQVAVSSSRRKSLASYALLEGVASPRNCHENRPKDISDSTDSATGFRRFGPRDCDGIHISSCGHAVHLECHNRYLTSLKQRHLRRLGFEGGHIVDPDLGELLCPVCRRFANSILPTSPCAVLNKAPKQDLPSTGSPKDNFRLPLALSLLQCSSNVVGNDRFQQVLSGNKNVTVKPALEPVVRKLCMLYSSHSFDNLSASGRLIQSLYLWDTLTHSIVSTEIAARGKPKACLTGPLSLESLYGELQSSSEFVLSLLLRISQTTRISSHHDQLLRFRGIQLLTGSLCFGVSGDTFPNLDKKRGSLSLALERADKGKDFPNILFYKQVADPVLAHDPFSSLMWALFCLPYPFISSIEFVIPLIHLFYCVCVVQALLTCYGRNYFDISCLGDCVFNDVCKMMGKSERVRKFFVSNYNDVVSHPKDMIRRYTFPYLRRCALLWKLLQSSTTTPLYDSTLKWELNPLNKDGALGSSIAIELKAIRELEDMFQIQSLEFVLNNTDMQSLAIKWCGHLCEKLLVCNYGIPLYSAPAIPFKLIQLPRLYQDLLQRYVKLNCSSCKSIPAEPALCLLCGKLCSPNWKSCCRASRCLNHATVCGAGIGVFLLVRRTTVFLQRSLRESSWPSPYLDAFGEEDRDMHRGKPLYLNQERYAALTYLVASHGLDRTSEILRNTTINLIDSE